MDKTQKTTRKYQIVIALLTILVITGAIYIGASSSTMFKGELISETECAPMPEDKVAEIDQLLAEAKEIKANSTAAIETSNKYLAAEANVTRLLGASARITKKDVCQNNIYIDHELGLPTDQGFCITKTENIKTFADLIANDEQRTNLKESIMTMNKLSQDYLSLSDEQKNKIKKLDQLRDQLNIFMTEIQLQNYCQSTVFDEIMAL